LILIAVPAVAAALVSVAAFFGQYSWRLDLIANFRPQLGVLLLVLGLLLMAGRWWKTGWAVLIIAVGNMLTVLPLFLEPTTPTPTEAEFRVLSFNLRASNEQFAAVIDYIDEVDADVVFLHEVSRPWELAIASADLDYQIYNSREGDLIFATLVMTKDEADVHSYGFELRGPRAVQVEVDGLTLLGIHPLSPTDEERAHLRNQQLGFVREWFETTPGPRVVAGDFNATPWSYPFRQLVNESGAQNSQRGFGLQASYPVRASALLRVPIDHLLLSEDLGVVDRQLGPALGSDHFPLVVDLALAG
jgi:endonuclease/exonuclease/phosphatase (EEP) superfamily protein YafD